MPMRRRASYGRRGPRPVVNTIKNVFRVQSGITGANFTALVAKAVTSPSPTVNNDVSHGCIIKAIYVIFDACGTGGTGVLNVVDAFLMKNPGANLTPPAALSVGSSNEKKFVIKQWRFMAMRNQDGQSPFHWEGWVPLPRRYWRMGTDDTWDFVTACTTALTGHMSLECIYKWQR